MNNKLLVCPFCRSVTLMPYDAIKTFDAMKDRANLLALPSHLLSRLHGYLRPQIMAAIDSGWPMYWVKGTFHDSDIELRAVTSHFKDGRPRSRSLRSCYDPAAAITIHMAIVACGGQVALDTLIAAVAEVDARQSARRLTPPSDL